MHMKEENQKVSAEEDRDPNFAWKFDRKYFFNLLKFLINQNDTFCEKLNLDAKVKKLSTLIELC